ncbi:hypothetical protein MQW34_11925 [Bacillus sp. ZJS3]|nr:hypothetical protein MQW34_11925 [Bacillus sp. ZJS3]
MDFKSMTLKEVNGLGKEFVANLLFGIEKSKKGPVVSNRTFPKMAKSNSYLTLLVYNTRKR